MSSAETHDYDALTRNAVVLEAISDENAASLNELYTDLRKERGGDYSIEDFEEDFRQSEYVEWLGNTEEDAYFELTEEGKSIRGEIVDLGSGGGG